MIMMVLGSGATAEFVHVPLATDGCWSLEAFPDLGTFGSKGIQKWEWEWEWE